MIPVNISRCFAYLSTGGRALTEGEISLARGIFGDTLDYSKVRIHDRRGVYGFVLDAPALTLHNHIYYEEEGHRKDFAVQSLSRQATLMHELYHVWEFQRGFDIMGGYFRLRPADGDYDKVYEYTPEQALQGFETLNFEQRAGFVQRFFVAKETASPVLENGLPYDQALHLLPAPLRAVQDLISRQAGQVAFDVVGAESHEFADVSF